LRSWSLVKPFGCGLFGFMWGWSGVWILLATPRALMAFRRNMLRESFKFQRIEPSLAENSVKRRLLAGLFFQFCDILARFSISKNLKHIFFNFCDILAKFLEEPFSRCKFD
jgi:hypothetical protein